MRRYYISAFLVLTLLFHNKIGECSLWEFNFQGYITEARIHQYVVGPTLTIEEILGVSIGDRMQSSSIYNTDAYLIYSGPWDVYRDAGSPVLTFDTFYVRTSRDELWITKDSTIGYGSLGSFMYGDPVGTSSVCHEDGWCGQIYGGATIDGENINGISYTLASFPTVLNTDNFDLGFTIGYFDAGPDPHYPIASVIVYGVIDTADIGPIPEPSTMLLLGSGLVGLVGYGRRRMKKEKSN